MKKKRPQFLYESTLFLGVLFVIMASAKAQQPPPQQPARVIDLVQAGYQLKREGFEPVIFKDSVIFHHQGAYMYCDSAYMYQEANAFEAFNNVRMEQGDSIFVYGDYMHYDGNTQLARLRGNIRMEDRTATLFTDSLNYDRAANLGYYFDGGMLVDDENELTSFWGQYSPESKQALFSDSVKLVNEDYTIYADTLEYNTETKIADILGPSRIVSDSGYIHTNNGWYNTVTEDARLLNRSQVYSNDGTKMLVGDTILYNRVSGEGEVFGNMHLEDFERKAILRGNYGFYNEKTEFGFATDSAFAVDYSQSDSLFIHGDRLEMATDSAFRDIKAYHEVRFFRSDLQGVCDSMHYSSRDSVVYLRGNPVIWNENNQILGNLIDVHLNDSTIDKAYIKEYALGIQDRSEENQYNQVSGRDMTALFRDGNLYHVLVEGNAESLYYLTEEDSTVIGLNKTESAYLSMDIENNQIEKLKLWSATSAVTTPVPMLKPEEMRLRGFAWLDYLRPTGPRDIFRDNKRRSSESAEPPKRTFVRSDETL